MGLRVTAEGVETEMQWHALAELGCHYAQGYLVGKPVDAAALESRLRADIRSDASDSGARVPTARVLELRRRD
jgi:EAL domain-containing protein (putative c-di-GMP-specific phosphodiesterase class I)